MVNGGEIHRVDKRLEDRRAIACLRRVKDASLPNKDCSSLVATTALMGRTLISIAISLTVKLIGLLIMMIGVTSIKAEKVAVTDI